MPCTTDKIEALKLILRLDAQIEMIGLRGGSVMQSVATTFAEGSAVSDVYDSLGGRTSVAGGRPIHG